jgi:ribosomal protein L7/L12
MKLELEGEWSEIQEICRRIGDASKHTPQKTQFDEQLAEIIRNDGLITAIKLHRERTGCSLRASKDYCENIKAQIGSTP